MPSKTQIAVTVAALQATLRPALALLPSEVKGSAAAGWLHLEDWMFNSADAQSNLPPPASFPFDEVATPTFMAQGRVFPSLAVDVLSVDGWASEGALTRQTRLILGFSNRTVSSEAEAAEAGTEETIVAFRKHREMYYDESDFEVMQKFGINVLRVPLGWWAFENFPLPEKESIVSDWCYPDKEFVTLSQSTLLGLLDNLSKHNISLLLDLHAFPCGSAEGTYNGVFPEPPTFFANATAMQGGLKIVDNMLSFLDSLPPTLRASVHGVTLMNEPGHMLPHQYDAIVAWLSKAVSMFRSHSFKSSPPPYLYMNLIQTILPNQSELTDLQQLDALGAIASDQLGLSGVPGAVLDVHHYLAWDAGMIEQGCGGGCAAMQRYLSDNITAFTAGMQNIAQKYKLADIAVSEWSLSSNHRDSRGCVDCLSIMYEGQATAFRKAGMAEMMWGWKMPYGGFHRPFWDLRSYLEKQQHK